MFFLQPQQPGIYGCATYVDENAGNTGRPGNMGLLTMAGVNRDQRHDKIHEAGLGSDGGR